MDECKYGWISGFSMNNIWINSPKLIGNDLVDYDSKCIYKF